LKNQGWNENFGLIENLIKAKDELEVEKDEPSICKWKFGP
jgi:hypothetical protein